MRKRLLYILTLLLAQAYVLQAQNYPVNATTVLTPPYSLYLSDYASADANAMQVILHLRELDRPEYRLKLRLTIEGEGVRLRTKPSYSPPPIILQGGTPEILTGTDISNYFNPNNLDFSGISKAEFLQRGALPEGFYIFKIEAVDYYRNVVVSNAGLANAWLVLNDPPLINLPFNNEKVVATDPQNVTFSWTPRHTASPNAAFSTEYEFTLVELYPDNRNPNDALRAANPIFRTTTTATSLNYGMMEPLLIPGRKYAFRLRAYDTEGRDLFKNNGYSEVYVFQFGDACLQPTDIVAEPLDPNRIKVMWEPQDIHTAFNVQYRKKGSSEWFEESLMSGSVIIPGLDGTTTYEYRVNGNCGSIAGEYTTIAEITTPETPENEFVCGADVPEIDISTVPLGPGLLKTGDMIKTADFDITISTLEANSGGSYRGEGFAFLPWLNFASVRVKFSEIMINEDYRVYSGNVTTIYSENSRFVADLDLTKDELNGQESGGSTGSEADDFDGTEVTIDGEVDTVYVNSDGDIVVETADGGSQTITPGTDEEGNPEDTRITDSNGTSWTVDKDGNVTKGGSGTGSEAPAPDAVSGDSVNFIVQFAPNTDQKYGFDSKDYELGQYENAQIDGKDYWIPWKSVATGGQDPVNVTTEKSAFPEFVGFKTASGEVAVQPGADAGKKQLLVTGKIAGETETLSAYVKVKGEGDDTQEVEVGKLNIATYNTERKQVMIVPVNDVSVPDVAAELNRIYGQAVAEWDVTVAEPFEVPTDDITGLDDGESGMLASFPQKMRQFNRAYKRARGVDNDIYYIFLVKGSNSSRSGFMPFKRQFGYIFTEKASDITKTIAHELAHGAFRLRHTFSSEAFIAAKGTTDNLMDYNGGTKLRKYQWDLVHDPESMVGWFQDDDESASVAGIELEIATGVSFEAAKTFLSPGGKPITLPENTQVVSFVSSSGKAAYGTVSYFKTDKASYNSLYEGTEFKGYAVTKGTSTAVTKETLERDEDGNILYYEDIFTKDLSGTDKVCLGYPADCQILVGYSTLDQFPSVTNAHTGAGDAGETNRFHDAIQNLTDIGFLNDNEACDIEGIPEDTQTPISVADAEKIYLVDNYIEETRPRREQDYDQDIVALAEGITSRGFISLAGETAVTSEDQKMLVRVKEKLDLLSRKTDHRIYVAIKRVSYVIPVSELNTLAQQVHEQAKLGENDIVVTVPVFTSEAINSANAHLEAFSLPMQGIYPNRSAFSFDPKNSVETNVVNAYRGLEKPLTRTSIFVSYNGDMVTGVSSVDAVSGYDIYEFDLWVDKRMTDFIDLVFRQKELIAVYNDPESYGELTSLVQLIDELDIELWNFPDHFPDANYSRVAHGIKEIYLEEPGENGLSADALQFAKWYVGDQLGRLGLGVETVSSPPSDHFILGRNEVVYQATLAKIDDVSVMLMPTNLDVFADIAGAVYAGYHQDWETSALYGLGIAGAAVPMASGGAFRKLVVELSTNAQKIGRKAVQNANNITLVTKADAVYSGIPFRLRRKMPWSVLWKMQDAGGDQLIKRILNSDLTDDAIAKLGKDLEDASLLNKFVQEPELVDAWKAVGKHANIRKHIPSLEKVSDLLNDADFMGKLPNGRADLDGIIDAVKNPLDGGGAHKLVKLADHLENVKQVVKKHSGADGFDKLMTDLKNPVFAMQDGATHMLNDVKNFASGKVKKFDYEFNGDGVVCTKCRFDVELSSGTPKLIEYKSWSLENIPNISSKQLTEYFRSATSTGDIKYVFNRLKTPSVADVKSQFQVIIGNNAKTLFEANSNLFKGIKMPDGSTLNISSWQQLEGLAKGNPDFYKSSLFDFIEVK